MTIFEENNQDQIKCAKWKDNKQIGYEVDFINVNQSELQHYLTQNISD